MKSNRSAECVVWCSFLVTGVILGLPVGSMAQSISRAGSVDQLYEKHVGDLQESIEKAREGNSQIEAENVSLRDEIEMLEGELKGLQNGEAQTDAVEDEPRRVLDYDALEAKENELYEQRYQNLLRRQSRLKELNERKSQNIHFFEADNEQSRELISQLKGDIGKLQSGIPGAKQHKSKTAKKTGFVTSADSSNLKALRKNINELEKRIENEKILLAKTMKKTEPLYKKNIALQDSLTSDQNELKKLQGKVTLLDKEVHAASSKSPLANEELTDEIAELQNQREELREHLTNLKRTAASIKVGSEKQEKQLTEHLQSLRQQQMLIKQRMKISSPNSIPPPDLAKRYDQLVSRKKSLTSEHARLVEQIQNEQTQKDATSQKGASKGTSVSQELAQSQKRTQDLQKKIDAISIKPKAEGSAALVTQVNNLETKLKQLRADGDSPLPAQQTAEEVAAAKEAVKQLESQRSIIRSSLNEINTKYKLDDLTIKGLGTQESELNEYLDVLSRENSALQEKLLTLQMYQDRQN